MNNRTVTQNGTYNNDKQANKSTKLHRHWAPGATIITLLKKNVYIYIYIYTYSYNNNKTTKYET